MSQLSVCAIKCLNEIACVSAVFEEAFQYCFLFDTTLEVAAEENVDIGIVYMEIHHVSKLVIY